MFLLQPLGLLIDALLHGLGLFAILFQQLNLPPVARRASAPLEPRLRALRAAAARRRLPPSSASEGEAREAA